jgi:hypothetical protein
MKYKMTELEKMMPKWEYVSLNVSGSLKIQPSSIEEILWIFGFKEFY